MTIKTLAQIGVNSFYTSHCFASRMPDESFYIRKDDAPEWVTQLVKEAHGEMFPDDYKYKFVVDALEALADADDIDTAEEIMREGIELYTYKLIHWVQSHTDRLAMANEHGKEFEADTIEAFLTGGQFNERWDVFSLVLSTLETLVEGGE